MNEELLEKLGKSQERILMIMQQYEDRLDSLGSKIKSLEVERDKVLKEGGVEPTSSSEIKRHYEAQIQEMKKSIIHLQNLLAQQKKALADQNKLETQLSRRKEELLELKQNERGMLFNLWNAYWQPLGNLISYEIEEIDRRYFSA
ncbi:kinesin-like protein KIF21A [Artemia franciscana]|uniref:kinesin-like protein KIF21A n=1 Tax=Artemia franciscana TaxID=6661 RepID=UPI0032DAA848